ncbi:MAG: hypothetical protein U9N83_06840 [Thermodesulfobacteriota bacterium]|nr:hypothetical protein [Thermodesulfobacteriota bacterium]
MLEITDEMIMVDIQAFQNRILAAREKLAMLPTGYLIYPQNKKCEKQRREYESEIVHVKKLIGIAKEALEEVSQ